MKLAELTQIALLGTDRQGLSLSPTDSLLGRLQPQLAPARRERLLLSLAALCAVREGVGQLPVQDRAPLPEPSPGEHLPYASEPANALLLRMLAGELGELLAEWLRLAAAAGRLARPESLPDLLDTGNPKPELRESILAVIGRRGLWLARQNPDWAWANGATGHEEDAWHTGERALRLAFLRSLRKSNPRRARELLAETWEEELPADRAVFLGTLEEALTPEDEEFLEAALGDKRKEVRKTAAALLARLPGSKLVERMVARTKPLLRFLPGTPGSVLKLKKTRRASIELTLPDECDQAMKRDGIEPGARQGFGAKAWWLIQMLEVVPLDSWTRDWQVSPADVVAASQGGDWARELLEGWTRAVVRQQNAAWADAFFPAAVAARHLDLLQGSLAAMAPAQREARLAGLLSPKEEHAGLYGRLIGHCRHDWSPDFSRVVLGFMRRESGRDSGNWLLRNQFNTFAGRLAPEVLSETAQGWPTDSKTWEFWSKGVDEFLAATQFRAELHAAFTKRPPS